jgi:hypothetical protein
MAFKQKDRSMASKIKLTKAQRKVIELLQRGEVIVHDERYFQVSDGRRAHRISWKVWYALTQEHLQVWDRNGPLIYQEGCPHFDWVLTKKGRDLKL